MKKLKYYACISVLFFISLNCVAGSINTFNLTFVNNTNTTLVYTQATDIFPNTVIVITPTTLLPGEKAELNSTSSNKNDLMGSLHFKDSNGIDNVFNIINYRKFHMGQAVFDMSNSRYYSRIQTKKLNPSSDPFALIYESVIVTIQNK
ncbi:MAG: hypothetical protein P4M12_02480 [Gammaproteobacteria bacterium]|nr:hypothetical protein [Gammaproteobacteria bacterium]